MTKWLTILLSDMQTAMIIFGSIGLVLLFAAFVIWNDVFRHLKK